MKAKNTYVYEYKNGLYFNLTNRCSNACSFCVRNHDTDLKEKGLWLSEEPSFDDVVSQIPQNVEKYDEFIFCGYGEPTYRLDLIKSVSEYLKQFNKTIRINTNGHGNKINNKNILEDLKNIDVISISLNAPDSDSYMAVCHSIYPDAFDEMLSFALNAKNAGKNVRMTLVDSIPKEQIEMCKTLCDKLGLTLFIREYY